MFRFRFYRGRLNPVLTDLQTQWPCSKTVMAGPSGVHWHIPKHTVGVSPINCFPKKETAQTFPVWDVQKVNWQQNCRSTAAATKELSRRRKRNKQTVTLENTENVSLLNLRSEQRGKCCINRTGCMLVGWSSGCGCCGSVGRAIIYEPQGVVATCSSALCQNSDTPLLNLQWRISAGERMHRARKRSWTNYVY